MLWVENALLQDAKRRALAVADARLKENVDLRAENKRLHSELDALKRRAAA
jgi:hypothetical protein